jgi:hypothetical protein
MRPHPAGQSPSQPSLARHLKYISQLSNLPNLLSIGYSYFPTSPNMSPIPKLLLAGDENGRPMVFVYLADRGFWVYRRDKSGNQVGAIDLTAAIANQPPNNPTLAITALTLHQSRPGDSINLAIACNCPSPGTPYAYDNFTTFGFSPLAIPTTPTQPVPIPIDGNPQFYILEDDNATDILEIAYVSAVLYSFAKPLNLIGSKSFDNRHYEQCSLRHFRRSYLEPWLQRQPHAPWKFSDLAPILSICSASDVWQRFKSRHAFTLSRFCWNDKLLDFSPSFQPISVKLYPECCSSR